MRTIERTSQFKRDYKRERKGKHRGTLDAELFPVVENLASDQPLRKFAYDSNSKNCAILGIDRDIDPLLVITVKPLRDSGEYVKTRWYLAGTYLLP